MFKASEINCILMALFEFLYTFSTQTTIHHHLIILSASGFVWLDSSVSMSRMGSITPRVLNLTTTTWWNQCSGVSKWRLQSHQYWDCWCFCNCQDPWQWLVPDKMTDRSDSNLSLTGWHSVCHLSVSRWLSWLSDLHHLMTISTTNTRETWPITHNSSDAGCWSQGRLGILWKGWLGSCP